jgi:hypothetical protein
MKYQLVVQWPAHSINDYDSLIEAENLLIDHLSPIHEVDGHDAGANQVNIFIRTDDFLKAFEEVRTVLQYEDLWTGARIAYRDIKDTEYVILWPATLIDFQVA